MPTTEEIRAEIAAARSRLSSNIEGLITQAHPKAVAARTVQDAKTLAAAEIDGVKAQFVDASGTPHYVRIGALAAAIIGSVAFLIVVRSIARG